MMFFPRERFLTIVLLLYVYSSTELVAQHFLTTFGYTYDLKSLKKPEGILTGDFNGDGMADLAVYNANEIMFYCQGATEADWQRSVLFFDHAISHVASARCNADRMSDLVVLSQDPPELSVYIAKKNMKFFPLWKTSLTEQFDNCIVGDINNDGCTDILLFGKKELGITVYLGRGNGTFKDPVVVLPEYSFSALSVHDIDNDGLNDLIGTNWISNELLMFQSFGKMNFGDPVVLNFAHEPDVVAVAPLDTDVNRDVIVGSSEDTSYHVLLGNGLGEYNDRQTVSLEGVPDAIAIEDMNGDGANDVCMFERDKKVLHIDLNNGHGAFQDPISFAAGIMPLEFTLFRHQQSSIVNAAVLDEGTSTIHVFQNDQVKRTFELPSSYALGLGPKGVLAADIHRDGTNDILVANSRSHTISLLLNTGGNLSGQIALAADGDPATIRYIAQNESTSAIIAVEPVSNVLSIHELNTHTFSQNSFSLPTQGTTEVLCTSSDQNNFLSVFAFEERENNQQPALIKFEQISPAKFIERNITPNVKLPIISALMVDHDLDGRQDIIYALYDRQHHREEVYESRGAANDLFGSAKKILSFGEPEQADIRIWAADLNKDGAPDLIVYVGEPEQSLFIATSISDTSFSPPVAISNTPVSIVDHDHLQVIDVNGDNIPDIVIENDLKKTIQLYLGRGNAAFLPAIRLATVEESGGFTLAHLTKDPIPQLIVTDAIHGLVKIIPVQEQ